MRASKTSTSAEQKDLMRTLDELNSLKMIVDLPPRGPNITKGNIIEEL